MNSQTFIMTVLAMLFINLFVMPFILAFPVMLLWNWVIPGIFSLPTINYWQAFGLNILCGLLFKFTVSTSK